MYTQRMEDRRCFCGRVTFPLKTKSGEVVEKDRRHIPDRRLSNIHLELIESDEQKFSEYFPDTSSHRKK